MVDTQAMEPVDPARSAGEAGDRVLKDSDPPDLVLPGRGAGVSGPTNGERMSHRLD